MLEIFKKILKIIIDILTGLVFLVLILIIAAKVVMMANNKGYFEIFGYSIFTVATGSMEPAIKQNDVIIVNSKALYNEDDVITYISNNAYITHRIVSISNNKIVTKGDANNTKDAAITRDAVVGKVVKVFTGLAVWQKVFTEPLIIIMIFVTLILFDFAFSYKGIKKKSNQKLVSKLENVSFEKVVQKSDAPKLTYDEIAALYEKTKLVQDGEDVKFDKSEKDFLNYTIRLDLNALQKEIENKMNRE